MSTITLSATRVELIVNKQETDLSQMYVLFGQLMSMQRLEASIKSTDRILLPIVMLSIIVQSVRLRILRGFHWSVSMSASWLSRLKVIDWVVHWLVVQLPLQKQSCEILLLTEQTYILDELSQTMIFSLLGVMLKDPALVDRLQAVYEYVLVQQQKSKSLSGESRLLYREQALQLTMKVLLGQLRLRQLKVNTVTDGRTVQLRTVWKKRVGLVLFQAIRSKVSSVQLSAKADIEILSTWFADGIQVVRLNQTIEVSLFLRHWTRLLEARVQIWVGVEVMKVRLGARVLGLRVIRFKVLEGEHFMVKEMRIERIAIREILSIDFYNLNQQQRKKYPTIPHFSFSPQRLFKVVLRIKVEKQRGLEIKSFKR